MVSSMSLTSSCSSGVSNASTGCDTRSRRGSPIRSTGLTAIERDEVVDDFVHARERSTRDGVDVGELDSGSALGAPRCVIYNDRDGRITEPQLAGEPGF